MGLYGKGDTCVNIKDLKVGSLIWVYGDDPEIQDDGPAEVYDSWDTPCVVIQLDDKVIKVKSLEDLGKIFEPQYCYGRDKTTGCFTEKSRIIGHAITMKEFCNILDDNELKRAKRIAWHEQEIVSARKEQERYSREAAELRKSQQGK